MSFASEVEAFSKAAVEATTKTIRESVTELFDRVVDGTPVGDPDTWVHPPAPNYEPGRLRGNWNASVGSPDFTNTHPVDPSGDRPKAEIRSALKNFTDGEVYLSNGVEYAETIEFTGYSKQAPKGMARLPFVTPGSVISKAARRNRV